MIPRYSTAIMESIWDTKTKYKRWLEIEILACEAMEKIGKIPKGTAHNIRKKANFNVGFLMWGRWFECQGWWGGTAAGCGMAVSHPNLGL